MEGLNIRNEVGRKVWAFVLLSVFLHLAFLCSRLPAWKQIATQEPSKPQKLLIRLAQNKSDRRNQVVESEKSEQKIAPSRKVFLSQKNNAFARETKAANRGSFRDAGKGVKNGQKELAAQIEKSLKSETLKQLSFSDLAAAALAKPSPKMNKRKARQVAKGLENGRNKKAGLASSSDYIEDLPLGDFTRLNTQEYEFYGFYHRIRQKLEQFWGAKLHERVEKIYRSGRKIASGRSLLTSLEIKMNAKGEIVQIHLGSTSGIKDLDDVAIEAFNQAGPFPNPPQGMVKDGLATIKWGFAVESN